MKQKLTMLVLAALSCLPALAFAVTPTITSVSGTAQTGQTLTITGTSMVQEDRTNWDPFFKTNPNASGFEGATVFADGYGAHNTDWNRGELSYDTTMKLMGSKSIKSHQMGEYIRQSDGSGMAGTGFNYALDAAKMSPAETWTDVYFRQYSRWNANSFTTYDYKYWWLLGGQYGYQVNLTGSSNDGDPIGSPTRSIRIFDGGWADSLRAYFPDGYIHNDKWYLTEMRFRKQGSGNYVVQFWIDNQLVLNQSVASGVSSSPNSWGWESITNAYNTLPDWNYNHWIDGFAVSHTRVGPASLIEIGNNANYATATKVYQSPEYLSDSSSQIKVNVSGLGAGPYYLWVTNSRGERSAPYSLTTTSSTAPATPGSLDVH